MDRLYKDLWEHAQSPREFYQLYQDNLHRVHTEQVRHPSDFHVVIEPRGSRLDVLRASLVLADKVSVYPVPLSPRLNLSLLPRMPGQHLIVPRQLMPELQALTGRQAVTARSLALLSADGGWHDLLFRALRPLVASDRVRIRPRVFVAVDDHTPPPEFSDRPRGKLAFAGKLLPVDQQSPFGYWNVQVPNLAQTIPFPATSNEERVAFEILVPYVHGVPFDQLCELLSQEEHRLDAFRKALRGVASECGGQPDSAKHLIAEIVQPELEALESALRRQVAHQVKCGVCAGLGAVPVCLSLYSASTVAGTIASWLAAAGIVGREFVDGVDRRVQRQQSPWYPLWRIGKKRRPIGLGDGG